jgi:hypothetical protein
MTVRSSEYIIKDFWCDLAISISSISRVFRGITIKGLRDAPFNEISRTTERYAITLDEDWIFHLP